MMNSCAKKVLRPEKNLKTPSARLEKSSHHGTVGDSQLVVVTDVQSVEANLATKSSSHDHDVYILSVVFWRKNYQIW